MILADMELPVLIVYAMMAVGFIVMVWGIKNMNKKSIARIIMIVGVLIFFGAFAASFMVSGAKSEDSRVQKNANTFISAEAEKIASYVANRFPENGTVAFLIDETAYNDMNSDSRRLFDNLRKRLEGKGVSCGEVLLVGGTKEVIDKKTGEETTVDESPTDPAVMKKALDQVNDQVDVVVNFVGLPNSLADLKKLTFLTRKNTATGKNNMILIGDFGLPYVEPAMLKSGRVCAVIDSVSDEGENFNIRKDTAPKDLSKAFDYMFYFINEHTYAEFIERNPSYFITK